MRRTSGTVERTAAALFNFFAQSCKSHGRNRRTPNLQLLTVPEELTTRSSAVSSASAPFTAMTQRRTAAHAAAGLASIGPAAPAAAAAAGGGAAAASRGLAT